MSTDDDQIRVHTANIRHDCDAIDALLEPTPEPPEPPVPPPTITRRCLTQLQWSNCWGLECRDPGDTQTDPNIQISINFTVPYSDTSSGWVIDRAAFEERLEMIPPKAPLYCSLDLEGDPLHALCKPNQARFTEAVAMFRDAHRWASELRPDALFSFYAVPLTMYWEQTQEAWDHQLNYVVQVTDRMDWLSPSIYDSYKRPIEDESDDAHLAWPVELAVAMAKPWQPVYPFTTHRYTMQTREESWELVADDMAQHNHIVALQAGAHGLVLWGAEPHYHTSAFQRNPGGTWERPQDNWSRARYWYDAEGCGEDGDIEAYNQTVLIPKIHSNAIDAFDRFDAMEE